MLFRSQWSKWQDPARSAYNEEIAVGSSFAAAVAAANEVQANTRSVSLLDVAEAATEVAGVVATVAPVVAIAKTVVKTAKGKGKK